NPDQRQYAEDDSTGSGHEECRYAASAELLHRDVARAVGKDNPDVFGQYRPALDEQSRSEDDSGDGNQHFGLRAGQPDDRKDDCGDAADRVDKSAHRGGVPRCASCGEGHRHDELLNFTNYTLWCRRFRIGRTPPNEAREELFRRLGLARPAAMCLLTRVNSADETAPPQCRPMERTSSASEFEVGPGI